MDTIPNSWIHTASAASRKRAEILYLMLKPSALVADMIWRFSHALGIESNYAKDRYHITLLPIGDVRYLPALLIAQLIDVLASFRAEPFELTLNRLDGNALKGSRPAAITGFQQQLIEHLLSNGFPVDDYDFRPHLSLTYGEWQPRSAAIPPMSWRADELLLIKSYYGQGRHEIVDRWPLAARQHSFDW